MIVPLGCTNGAETQTKIDHPVTGKSTAARFVPATPPTGFAPADSIRHYGTAKSPLGDGTIFDYIDGGGIVYIGHGFVNMAHAVFTNKDGVYFTLDIFDMGTPLNTRSLMADEAVCPSGYTPMTIGSGGKMYSFPPDVLIHFITSRYFVSITVTDDSYTDTAAAYASVVADSIK
jgi:hypothetical protein